MSWSQELKLLDLLSRARSTTQFTDCSADIQKLCDRVEKLALSGFRQLLLDGVFTRRLVTAASHALLTACATWDNGSHLSSADCRCITAFLAVVYNVLKNCLCLAPAAFKPPQHVDFKISASARASAIGMLTDVEGTLKQTGK